MMTRSLTSVRAKERLLREEDGLLHEQKSKMVPKSAGTDRVHTSVMIQAALEALALTDSDLVLDATAGEGGHSEAILLANRKVRLIALDADQDAVRKTRVRLAPFGPRAQVFESNFTAIEKILKTQHIPSIDKALFDLGWNASQLVSGRGFSFLHDEPLNMSYGKKSESGFTAAEILNEWEEETLANVFYGYGEERYARRIAKAIVERRHIQPIQTTIELVEIIRDSTPALYHKGRIHFATRTFQALRIAVNDELGALERGLRAAWNNLSSGGRVIVISFHSIEDRIVKRLFIDYAKKDGELIYKKPRTPSTKEIGHNPRARSAKLRAITKL